MPRTAEILPLLAIGSAPQEQGIGLVPTIGVAIIVAAALAVLLNRLKQPALLAYIAAGFLLSIFAEAMVQGAAAGMEDVSHLGLVFLLFIIGLEMNLKGILMLGPRVALALMLQAPVTIAAVYGLQWLAGAAGYQVIGLGSGPEAWFFFAVAASLSSTAVVVRLLGEKFDLESQAGKATVLTLIAQDIWAVLALSYVTSAGGGQGEGPGAALMLGGGVALAAALLLTARQLVSRVMVFLAKAPDLIALVALGWCFVCAAGFARVGLSAEMGALIAGLSLGSLPVAAEVLAKVSSLRDFFMALFFVALGMSLPPPTTPIILAAVSLVLVGIIARLALFAPVLLAVGLGPIVSLTISINLAQISEFCLLLTPIGLASGMLAPEEASVISYALMLSVLLSTYGIKNNYRFAILLANLGQRLGRRGRRFPAAASEGAAGSDTKHGAEVVMLGYFNNADALVRLLETECPELLPKILVIDYNLQNHERIAAHGVRVAYGDISNPDTLRHFGIEDAKVALSTISDTFLRATSNEKLLEEMRLINPGLVFIGTADNPETAARLARKGAFACVCPPEQAAPLFLRRLREALGVRP